MEKAGVDIRLNTEVTPELVRKHQPEALIIAIGSKPTVPPIPGIEHAIVADDLPDMMDKVGQDVVVIGAGLVGCETAVHLAQNGRNVTVVEMGEVICPDANPRHRPLLLAELEKSVKCLVNTLAVGVTEEGVLCESGGEKMLLPAKTAILAAGRTVDSAAVDALRQTAPYAETIGDCVKPGDVAAATFRGHYAAIGI